MAAGGEEDNGAGEGEEGWEEDDGAGKERRDGRRMMELVRRGG